MVVWFSVVRYDGHGHVLLHQGGQRPVPRLLPQRRRHLPLHHVRRRLLEGGCGLRLNFPSLGVRCSWLYRLWLQVVFRTNILRLKLNDMECCLFQSFQISNLNCHAPIGQVMALHCTNSRVAMLSCSSNVMCNSCSSLLRTARC